MTTDPTRAARSAGPAAFLCLAAGCGDDHGLTAPELVPVPQNVTTTAELFAAHERAFDEKDAAAYVAHLEPAVAGRSAGFRYYVRYDDWFSWLQGDDYWSWDVEAEIIGNLMDPEFVGEELPVDTIEATFTILSEKAVDGVTLVLTDAEFRILVGPDTGWFSDTRFEYDLVADGDGFLRIRRIQEIRKTEPSAAGADAVDSSFGRLKSLYY